MQIEVRRAEYRDVEPMRGLYRAELNCQIIHDSFLARGQSDPYLILVDGRLAGYGAVSNKYGKGRLNEFYTAPRARGLALPMFRELLAVSEATHIETQTNFAHAVRLRDERNGRESAVSRRILLVRAACSGRRRTSGRSSRMVRLWLAVACCATTIRLTGISTYMDVVETERRKGFGSHIVQELNRVCYEIGKKPAVRCNADNLASRRTREKAGMLPCGRLLVAEVR
jgi:GNAT superfamily N-acetyltransferase